MSALLKALSLRSKKLTARLDKSVYIQGLTSRKVQCLFISVRDISVYDCGCGIINVKTARAAMRVRDCARYQLDIY